MAKKKRPDFSRPSTDGPQEGAPKTDWVYRSDDAAASPKPAARVAPAAKAAATKPAARIAPSGNELVALYSRWSAAAGVMPVPVVGAVAVGALQLKMIAALAEHYGVAFNHEVGKSLLAAVIGSTTAVRLASSVVPLLGLATGPALGYASTWAIGRVFVNHFEAGGTLANADPAKMKKEFQQLAH
jgi:uncharacterized protein (DUF697 family)